MSKEKPEVGDVWKYSSCCLMYVYEVLDNDFYNVLFFQDGEYWTTDEYLPDFNNYTYLGKSKVSIKELFDVAEN